MKDLITTRYYEDCEHCVDVCGAGATLITENCALCVHITLLSLAYIDTGFQSQIIVTPFPIIPNGNHV